jgi:hypothetical protein
MRALGHYLRSTAQTRIIFACLTIYTPKQLVQICSSKQIPLMAPSHEVQRNSGMHAAYERVTPRLENSNGTASSSSDPAPARPLHPQPQHSNQRSFFNSKSMITKTNVGWNCSRAFPFHFETMNTQRATYINEEPQPQLEPSDKLGGKKEKRKIPTIS